MVLFSSCISFKYSEKGIIPKYASETPSMSGSVTLFWKFIVEDSLFFVSWNSFWISDAPNASIDKDSNMPNCSISSFP